MKKRNYLVLALVSLIVFFLSLVCLKFFNPLDIIINNSFLINQSSILYYFSLALAFIFDTTTMAFLIIICAVLLFFYKGKKEGVFLASLGLADGILVFLFKHLIKRARPENLIETGFSFPSGHTTIAVVFLGFWIYFLYQYVKNKPLKIAFSWICIILGVFVGLSRLVLGVHWFSDVLAGFFLGGFILFWGIWLRKV